MKPSTFKKKKLISINISCLQYRGFIEQINQWAVERQSTYVCVANVHMLVEAHNDPTFANVVNSADLVTPDGMPLVKALDWVHGVTQERVAGMDLLPDLLNEASEKEIGVFFYGGTENMLALTDKYVKTYFPNLKISGSISPPFRALTPDEESDHIDQINTSGAGFVFVALGCPKQERWMFSMKGRINSCMIGIGGALPVMLGLQPRAPKWMQEASLEWAYRFYKEPRRLFKRYVHTNSLFIYLLSKKLIGNLIKNG